MVLSFKQRFAFVISTIISIAAFAQDSAIIQVKQYRIDATHSNSYEVWKKMGSCPGRESYL
jgi:hypothetical protein